MFRMAVGVNRSMSEFRGCSVTRLLRRRRVPHGEVLAPPLLFGEGEQGRGTRRTRYFTVADPIFSPVVASQTVAVMSTLAVTTRVPSGLNAAW